jgi:hypothetical protein
MNDADALYKLFLALVFVAATQAAPAPPATPSPAPPPGTPVATSPSPPALPQVAPSIMGIEFFNGFTRVSDEATRLNAAWVRFNNYFWSDVEPAPGDRKWSAMASVESDLIAAAQRGIQVILVVRRTPVWARAAGTPDCVPPSPGNLPAFARFMRDAVARYSAPPFNVKHWEMGNEVDLDPSLEGGYGVWGCWGNRNDAYYGGGYYADMLKAVTPAMKAVDPAAQVLVGGLMLECPSHFDTCTEHKFFEGILVNGGGPFFDGVGYHAYDGYAYSLGQYSNPKWESSWNTTGPVMIAKLRFLQSALQRHGIAGKYFVMSEGSLICWSCDTAPPEHELTKAYYVPQLFAAGMANNVRAVIWYSYNSQWMHTALLQRDNQPTAAYTAMRVLLEKLPNATYLGELTTAAMQQPNARGSRFRVNGREVWLAWSVARDVRVTLPANPAAITDALGNAQPAARAFTLTPKPLYIEW